MDEQNNTPQPSKTTVNVTPLSVASVGPLNAMVFRKETEKDGKKKSELMVSLRRNPVQEGDDPNSIPLIELPALVMLLKAVAEPSMNIRTLPAAQPAAPPDPVPPVQKPAPTASRKAPKGKRK